MGSFKNPSICWRDSTAAHKQSMQFLYSIDDNAQTTRRGAWLDLVLTNKEGLVGDMKVEGCLTMAMRQWSLGP